MTITMVEGVERLQLPVTEFLLGRFDEMDALFNALDSENTAIIGISAAGGRGKSALVSQWIRSLEDDQQREIDCLFSWIFFDEEKGLPNASSDAFFYRIFNSRCFSSSEKMLNFSSPEEQARNLLRWYLGRRMVIVLDNIEALQRHSGQSDDDGRFYDEAIRLFLTDLFKVKGQSHVGRHVIVTSRERFTDLEELAKSEEERPHETFKAAQLDNLTTADSIKLLRDLGVTGEEGHLKEFSEDYQNHALTLVLLGRMVVETGRTDHATLRDELSNIVPLAHEQPTDPQKRDREHARTLLEYYISGRVLGEHENTLLRMMALFHRPMELAERNHLLRNADLCTGVAELSDQEWESIHCRLQRLGLLQPGNEGSLQRWNSHALVREYFRDECRDKSPDLWRQANSTLYDYLTATPKSRQPETRGELVPLHRAVHHGCHAGRYREALMMYRDRILQGDLVSHGSNELGTVAEDSAALRMFFKPRGSELIDAAKTQLDPVSAVLEV